MRELLGLAFPMVVTMISQTVMQMADGFIVAMHSSVEFEALFPAGILYFTLFAFFSGLVQVVTTFVGQFHGAGQPERASAACWQGIYISLGSGFLLLLLLPFAGDIMDLLMMNPIHREPAALYFMGRLVGSGPAMMTLVMANFFIGIGITNIQMVVTIIGNALNIILDMLLVFGVWIFPELGIYGAGLATSIASALSCGIIMTVFLSRKYHLSHNTRRAYRTTPSLLWRMLRVGTPIGLQFSLDIGSFTIFTYLVQGLGTDSLFAHNAAIYLMHIGFMPSVGVGIAVQSLVARYIGAGRPDLSRRSFWSGLKITLPYMATVGLIFFLFGKDLVSIFLRELNPERMRLGGRVLTIVAIFQVFDAMAITATNALRGAGDTRFPMLFSIFTAYCIALPSAYLLGFLIDLKLPGAWAGMGSYFVLLGIVLYGRFLRGGWEKIRLVTPAKRPGPEPPAPLRLVKG